MFSTQTTWPHPIGMYMTMFSTQTTHPIGMYMTMFSTQTTHPIGTFSTQTTWPHPIGMYMTRCLQIDFHLLSEYCQTMTLVTYGMVWPMKLKCGMFNKVFLVNHWHDILDFSCKGLCFNNSYKCIGPKP